MRPTEMKVLSGMVAAATTAERQGNSISITRTMTIMLSIRLTRKSFTLSRTTCGKSVIRLILTSSGR